MITLFRRIRQKLIDSGSVSKYLLYAIGEILLIVFGILIALELDNRSTEMEMTRKFNYGLEQLYTNLYLEISFNEFLVLEYENRMEVANLEIDGDPGISVDEVPYRIEFLNSYPLQYHLGNEEVINTLQENIVTPQHNVLMNQINSYFSIYEAWTELGESQKVRHFDVLYNKYRFPLPSRLTSNMYSEDEIQLALLLREDEDYLYLLQTAKNTYEDLRHQANYKLAETNAILEYFEDVDYNVQLNFNNIGIIGSASPDGWEKSTPMNLIDREESVWSIETYLNDGFIKFRNGNNWNQNWGANDQYDGNTLFFGRDIPVQEGFYQVTLNLAEKRYEITEIPEVSDDSD
jgi:hypothetical protein